MCKKDWRASDSFAWLECTTWRVIDNTGALAFAARTTCVTSLSTRNSLYCIHVCRTHRKWLSTLGIHIVCIENSPTEIKCQKNKTNLLIRPCLSVDVSAKSLRTPSNVFVINLAFCDFLMMAKTPIFIYNSFNHGYALGSTGCQIFSLVGALSGIGAAITNAFIAYDRYVLYKHKYIYREKTYTNNLTWI